MPFLPPGAEVLYSQLMSDFEMDEKDFDADSWSLAVDNSFLQQHKKEVMKRQDVIYELIQTELHHVQTLKIMTNLFRKGMLEDLQMDASVVQSMFPCVDELSEIHGSFLARLLERRKESLADGSPKNFVINRLGDILIQQRLSRSSVLRRHGVQECILLVTQRITKYPGLIDRILQNSRGTRERPFSKDLKTALTLVKELLSTIDQEVHNQEKNARLQEIYGRVDGRTKAHLPWERGPFSKEEMLRRKLVHDGCMLWKTPAGRFKDVLIFLQEKDQKYIFPTLNLIVRDIANQEKGMFLISSTPPEMYEVHAASRDDRNTWMKVIQQSVKLCPHRAEFPLIETESEASLRKLKDKIQQCDQEIGMLLKEKAELFADLVALQSGREDDGETGSTNDTLEFARVEANSNHRDGNGNQLQPKGVQEEMLQRLKSLYSLLHGLQGIVAHQDSLLAFQAPEAVERQRERLSRSNSCKEAPPADQHSAELALLQKQHALLQQELNRCRQLGQEKAQEVASLEARLRESEGERQRLEREADEARRQLAAPRVPLEAVWVRKAAEPRRRSLPAGDALYQSFIPPPQQNRGGDPLSPGCHSLHRTFSSGQREEASFPGVPARLQEEAEEHLQLLMEEEGLGNSRSPPSSPRDFQRMQDIPEEVESLQESNAGDGDLLGS
ncbi:hypothetical protein Chor_014871 [Crotalus horridus]